MSPSSPLSMRSFGIHTRTARSLFSLLCMGSYFHDTTFLLLDLLAPHNGSGAKWDLTTLFMWSKNEKRAVEPRRVDHGGTSCP